MLRVMTMAMMLDGDDSDDDDVAGSDASVSGDRR